MNTSLHRLMLISKIIVFEPRQAFERIRHALGINHGSLLSATYRRILAQVAPRRLVAEHKKFTLSEEQQEAAFAKGLKITLCDTVLHKKEALSLSPAGQSALIQALAKGIARGYITAAEARCFAQQLHHNPIQELMRTWRFNVAWQKTCPDGISIFGRQAFADWLFSQYRLPAKLLTVAHWPDDLRPAEHIKLSYYARVDWQAKFPQALTQKDQAVALVQYLCAETSFAPHIQQWCAQLDHQAVSDELIAIGVNVLGHFSYPSGLRSSTESIVADLRHVGVPTSLRNVRVDMRRNEPTLHVFNDLELFDISIIHIQPEPFFSTAYRNAGLLERAPKTYRVAYWYWEFDSAPSSWKTHEQSVDEFWVATEFIAKGLREQFTQPVHVLMPSLTLPQFDPKPRAYFHLPDGTFIFSFVFHMSSVMERKNPLGLINAFKQAFTMHDDVLLVIKTSFGAQYPAQLKQLRAAASGYPIVIIDRMFSQAEVLSLMNCSDAYVSLHRCEGLGLTMSEAMLLGKPVIATRYSGNLDFMNDANSYLVHCDLVTTRKEYPPYPKGLTWAEPSIEHAAQLMRQLYEQPAQAQAVGQYAQQDLHQRFNHHVAGTHMNERLKVIKQKL